MRIIEKTTDFQLKEPTAVVLGKFDGVHLGHRFLLEKLLEQKQNGLRTVVFTFDKSPASLLGQNVADLKELCTREEKRAIIEALGVDVYIEFPMNEETVKMTAEVFVEEYLSKRLCCKCLIAGDDLRFGYKGLGNAKMLKEHSFSTRCQMDIYEKLPDVSSSIIREAITMGDIVQANAALGYPYEVTGQVVRGMGLAGSVLHMPTANIIFPKEKVLPMLGVYFTRVKVDGTFYNAITNVGKKPTVLSSTDVFAETYLYDFAGDLYGKELTIYFEQFLRKEETFADIYALADQLEKDRLEGQAYWLKR